MLIILLTGLWVLTMVLVGVKISQFMRPEDRLFGFSVPPKFVEEQDRLFGFSVPRKFRRVDARRAM